MVDSTMPPETIVPDTFRIVLLGYPLETDKTAEILIFPVQRYRELNPSIINPRVSALRALTGGNLPGSGELPFLPVYYGYRQVFHSQYAMIPFQNGKGIRFLTMYSSETLLINNEDLFFAYQGLTSDQKYWISVILPVSHPSLPTYGDLPSDKDGEAIYNNPEPYFIQITKDLNAQPAESFSPPLDQLDRLIHGMSMAP